MNIGGRLAAVVLVGWIAACGSNETNGGNSSSGAGGNATVCEPGKQEGCACPGDGQGAQRCRDDGSGWETCECSGSAGTGGSYMPDATPDSAEPATDAAADVENPDAPVDSEPDAENPDAPVDSEPDAENPDAPVDSEPDVENPDALGPDALEDSAGACPAIFGTTDMVKMAKGYCIDRTSVTRAQYAAWRATNPTLPTSVPGCEFKTSYSDPPANADDIPVTLVDWCDAFAYCQGVGKRLCGKIGGGTNAVEDYADAARSQWYDACSEGGTRTFPYGDTYDSTLCNTGSGTIAPVGSYSGCHPIDLVYDLSGNAWEWEDSCGLVNGSERCLLRGGSWLLGPTDHYRCDFKNDTQGRTYRSETIGFRCCAEW